MIRRTSSIANLFIKSFNINVRPLLLLRIVSSSTLSKYVENTSWLISCSVRTQFSRSSRSDARAGGQSDGGRSRMGIEKHRFSLLVGDADFTSQNVRDVARCRVSGISATLSSSHVFFDFWRR